MRYLFILSVFVLFVLSAAQGNANEPLVFISSFAAGDKGAIRAYRFDTQTGALNLLQVTTGVENPFFLALAPNGKFLYTNHAKQFGGKENEQVAAYEIVGRTGQLKPLNRQSSLGTVTCYLQIDATGRTAVTANYGTGSTASLPVKEDGTLGEAASFFQHVVATNDSAPKIVSHAHCAVVSPDNRYVYVADLGLDQVLTYRLDAATSKLTRNDPPFAKVPDGAGPRHLTFHPGGKLVYVINEKGNSVTVFDYDAATGSLTEKQTISTLPKEFAGKSYCADVKITPNGRFLYGTNRGHDSIAAYRIGEDGRLTLIGIEPSLGKGPQNLAITAAGDSLLCANMPGNNVAVFRIDSQAGVLKSVGEPTSIPSPSCIMLLP